MTKLKGNTAKGCNKCQRIQLRHRKFDANEKKDTDFIPKYFLEEVSVSKKLNNKKFNLMPGPAQTCKEMLSSN